MAVPFSTLSAAVSIKRALESLFALLRIELSGCKQKYYYREAGHVNSKRNAFACNIKKKQYWVGE
jgi:hypothetical protein